MSRSIVSHRRGWAACIAFVAIALGSAQPSHAAVAREESVSIARPSARDRAEIRRTAGGTPHIKADSWEGLGFGFAWALAEDNLCVVADDYVTLRGERSRFFGASGSYSTGSGYTWNNLDSDFYYRRLAALGVVERLAAQRPPDGPIESVRRLVAGYARGYNAYLASGRAETANPSCAGEPWLRPIAPIDIYRRFFQLAALGSSGAAIQGIATAQPPIASAPAPAAAVTFEDAQRLADALSPKGLGSNGVALGSELTASGRGMLLVNPHYQWAGTERFYQFALTLPGRLESSGGAFLGSPIPFVGFNRHLAWTHTIANTLRFTPYELTLVEGDPTAYVVDGRIQRMTAIPLTVEVLEPDGSVTTRSRTLYDSGYGPLFTAVARQSLFPWTSTKAYALKDANAQSLRGLNHFLSANRAQSVDEYERILRRYQGVPWAHEIAADWRGVAYYADIGPVPNVPESLAQRCNTALGALTYAAARLPVLDGSRSDCAWANDADAAGPGLFGPSHLPSLKRRDYVTNSNDSHWLSNPAAPLVGFAPIIGDEGIARSLRTRMGLRLIRERIDSGLPFDLDALQALLFSDRTYSAEMWRDALVESCRATPLVDTPQGPIDVSAACDAVAGWDRREDVDSRGGTVWRRFMTNLLRVTTLADVATVPFALDDPIETPRGLDTADPRVLQAFALAVRDLRDSGIPVDAPLGDWQYVTRGGERIALHGGPDNLGVFNVVNAPFVRGAGWPDVPHGASILMAIEFRRAACPVRVRSLLAYSESTEPTSAHAADQTWLYSRKQWIDLPFCESEIARAPELTRETVGSSGPDRGVLVRVRSRQDTALAR